MIKIFLQKQSDDPCVVDSVLIYINKFPNSIDKYVFGHPYKKWYGFMKYKPLDYYVDIEIPILLIHGSDDINCHVESARYLKDKFTEVGKENLDYIELADMDHSFNDNQELLVKIINDWLLDKNESKYEDLNFLNK